MPWATQAGQRENRIRVGREDRRRRASQERLGLEQEYKLHAVFVRRRWDARNAKEGLAAKPLMNS